MSKKKFIVIGAGGFVGLALTKALINAGHSVLAIARGDYPVLRTLGAETIRADISKNVHQWSKYFAGADGVFHTAAKVEMWGPLSEFLEVNVTGTENVIRACKEQGVKRLVFTSSPSVVADGNDLKAIDESYPYPQNFQAHYPRTKSMAEKLVLAANDSAALTTVALRPHLIFGPGDTNLIPAILERAKAGKLIRVGSGQNVTDLTYIDDCVNAHLLAMQALETKPRIVGGKAYFISQGDPVNMWDWINTVLIKHGLDPVKKSVPVQVAKAIATLSEGFSKLLSLFGIKKEPALTRFLVCEMSTSHYFNISRARDDLGYSPRINVKEATAKLAA